MRAVAATIDDALAPLGVPARVLPAPTVRIVRCIDEAARR
jgi:hypothetical protein